MDAPTLAYATSIACELCNLRNWMASAWTEAVAPYLVSFVPEKDATEAVIAVLHKSREEAESDAAVSRVRGELGKDGDLAEELTWPAC